MASPEAETGGAGGGVRGDRGGDVLGKLRGRRARNNGVQNASTTQVSPLISWKRVTRATLRHTLASSRSASSKSFYPNIRFVMQKSSCLVTYWGGQVGGAHYQPEPPRSPRAPDSAMPWGPSQSLARLLTKVFNETPLVTFYPKIFSQCTDMCMCIWRETYDEWRIYPMTRPNISLWAVHHACMALSSLTAASEFAIYLHD